jgi:hypothetical protein
MSDHLVELPAPVMSEAAFQRRREHLLAETQRATGHRRVLVSAIAATAVLVTVLLAAPAWALVRDVLPFWNQPSAPSRRRAHLRA